MPAKTSFVVPYCLQGVARLRLLALPVLITTFLLGCSGDSSSGSDPAVADVAAGETTLDNLASVDAIPDDVFSNDALPDTSGSVAVDADVAKSSIITETQGDAAAIDTTQAGGSVRTGKQSSYYMPQYEYPGMVTLPLQFITRANGEKLGVLVTLPADDSGAPVKGEFPVVLVQTGYNMHLLGTALRAIPGMSILGAPDKLLVRRGYAQVSVDVVGTGVSQGGWELFGEDEQIGYGETVDWILEQPWSNGNIGVAGVSYMAISALYTAQQRPDAIKAVFAMSPIGDAMRGIVGTGGLINGLFISVWASFTHAIGQQNQLPLMMYPQYRDYIKSANQQHYDQLEGFLLPLVEDALNGEPYITYDGEFWRTRSTLTNIDSIKAPTFVTGSLTDIFQRDAPLLYEALKKNVDSRLVIYDGDHVSNFLQAFPGGDEVDPVLSLYLQWFDKYLKGIDTGVENIAPVTQYVKNYSEIKRSKGLWRGFATTTDWPHPQAGAERWYLHGDLTLDTAPPADVEITHSVAAPEPTGLSWGKSENGKYVVSDLKFYDGSDCSISYRQWTLGIAGILDGKDCFYENNTVETGALNFESAPMVEDYYFNGPVQADIWLESSATEAVLSVRLDEVAPDGVVRQISNGLMLASNRAVDESRSRYLDGEMIQPVHYLTEAMALPVVPGEVIKVPVEIFPTSIVILKGHKLRVSIAASNQAQGMLNYPRQAQLQDSTMTIHNSPQYPSSIVLPVVPLSALN